MAVDPANPQDTVALEPSSHDDPIRWSPDGTQLLLSDYGLIVMAANGSKTDLLSGLFVNANGSRTDYPSGGGSSSSYGSKIAYAIGGDRGGVYVIDADGRTNPRLIAEADSPGPCGQSAAWSPDGSRIAFIDFEGPYGPTCHPHPPTGCHS